MYCKFTCSNRCFNIINIYCPCAELINDRIADYLSVLNDASNRLANLKEDIIVMGDFNASIVVNLLTILLYFVKMRTYAFSVK